MAKTKNEEAESVNINELKPEIREDLKKLEDSDLFKVGENNGVDVKKYKKLTRAQQRMNVINRLMGVCSALAKAGKSKRAIIQSMKP